MTTAMLAPRTWRSMGVLCLVAIGIGLVVFAATRSDGRPGSQSASNDGGAWLLKRDAGAVGHLNREVLEVTAGIKVAAPGADIDIDQSSDVIVVHDRSSRRLMLIDGRTNQTRGDLLVPSDVVVEAANGSVVVWRAAPLAVWDPTVDELSSISDLDDLTPTITGTSGLVAVGADTTAVYDSGTGTVATLRSGIETGRRSIDEPSALTISGGQVVAAVDDHIVIVDTGESIDIGPGPLTLQQPGVGPVVVIDADRVAHRVGSIDTAALPSATADPINHGGCLFALVDGPGLLRHCDSTELLPIDGARGDLRLRLVNGWIWVNDLETGGAWITNPEAPLSRIDDWGSALAEDRMDESDATVEDGGGIEEIRRNPDADDVQVIDADQQDDDEENEPPVARDDSTSTRVDRPVVIRVLDNDEDADGDVLLIESVEPLGGDSQVWITHGRDTIQVTPPAGFAGTVSFVYAVTDGRGGSAQALVTVEVTAPDAATNRPPTPVTDIATARSGSAASLNVLDNDTDPDGDALLLTSISSDEGTIVFDPSGQISFTPDTTGQAGRVELTYRVADDFGATAEGKVIVNVRLAEANSSPDARNDSVVTGVGNPARINLLDNDTDPDGDPLIVARQPILSTGPDDATAQVTSDGEFFFIPTASGTYVFDYLVSDGQSNDNAQIRVDVSESGVNLAPVAVRDDVSIPIGGTRLVYVLDNDGDPNGDIVDIVEWSGAQGLQIEPVPGVGFRVTVDTDAPPRATFRYAISDGIAEPVATVVVVSVTDVAAVNQAPVVRPDTIELRPGHSTTISVLRNDFDPEGGSLSVIGLPTSDAAVTYELGADGQSIVITLAATATNGFTFAYDVSDLAGATAASVVDVRVIGPLEPNRPPVARPDIGRTVQGTTITLAVLVNDTDPDGDVIAIESIATQPGNGQAELVEGTIRYTPSPTFAGTDRFAYVLIDSQGARTVGEIQVGVTTRAVENRPPSANDDRIVADRAVVIDVLANDHDPDNDTLQIVSNTDPTLGSLERSGNTLRFTPPAVAEPVDVSFVYEISDGHANTDDATVHLTIQPPPPPLPPVATDDAAGPIRANREITVDVLANDIDPDGETLTLTSLDTAAIVVGDQLLITVDAASIQARYRITDADGLTDTGTVNVIVVENQAPTIAPLRVTTGNDTPITLALDDQADDPDSDDLFFVCCDGLRGGTVDIVESALGRLQVTFTPSPGFEGAASFSYSADDQAGHLVAGSVVITVEPPDNRPPTAVDGSLDIEAGTTIPFDLASLVTDPDDDPLSFELAEAPFGATLTGSRVTVSAPIIDAGNTGTVRFRATDPDGLSVVATLAVTVTPVSAAPPRAIADQASTNQGAPVTIDVLLNDLDPLGQGLTIIQIGAGVNGTAQIAGSSVVYTPNPSFFGTATMTYTIHDAAGANARESVGQVRIDVVGRPGIAPTPTANADNAVATLTWTAAVQNGAPIDTYRIETRSVAGSGSIDVGPGNSHTFSGLTNGADYEFRIQARNVAGWGEWSPWSVPVRPDTIPDRPAAPAVAFGNAELAITWTAPANTGSAITGYQLEIGGGVNQVVSVGTSPYTWRGLTNGTEYQFRVAAVNTAGRSDWSAWSTSEHPLSAPSAPAAPAVARGNRNLDLSWPAPNNNGDPIGGYEIQMQSSGQTVAVAGGATTTYRWANLTNGQAQQFRVRASNRSPSPGAWSAWSTPVVPCTVPDAPGAPTVLRGDRQVTVSWGTPGDQGCAITSYTIRSNGATVQTTGVTNSHVFTGLANGTSYNFDVAATNEEGIGLWSAASAAVVPAGNPTTPSISFVTAGAAGQLTAAWSGADPNGSPILRNELSINGGAPIGVGAAGHTVTGLADSTGYDLRVRACNDVGCGPYSGTVSGTTWGPPSVPVGVNATTGSTIGTVAWSTPSSTGGTAITGYQVTLSNGASFSVGEAARSQGFTGLTNGTTYTASVTACNAVGCSTPASAGLTPQAPPVTVSLTRGAAYTGAGCVTGNCQWMHVEVRNLTPNTTVGVSCFDSVDQRFVTVYRTSDGAGSLSSDPCYMGFPGRQVWTSVNDPVRAETTSNVLIW